VRARALVYANVGAGDSVMKRWQSYLDALSDAQREQISAVLDHRTQANVREIKER
jgi:membrane protein required for beta-lactamase induction